jgi:hypothetical protein
MTDEPHTHRPSFLSLLGWLSMIAVTVGGFYTMRSEFTMLQAAQNERLAEQIDALKEHIATIAPTSSAAVPDAALNETLVAVNSSLAAIEQRLAALEAKPQPEAAPAVAAPIVSAPTPSASIAAEVLSGKPYATALTRWAEETKPSAAQREALQRFADTGLPSELALRDAFNATLALLGEAPKEKALGGLVTVRKRDAADPYLILRNLPLDTPLASIENKLSGLPADLQAPFAQWRDTVAAREAARLAISQ